MKRLTFILLLTTIYTTNVEAKNIFCSNTMECNLISQMMYQTLTAGFDEKMKKLGINDIPFPVSYNQVKSYFNTCGQKERTKEKAIECFKKKMENIVNEKFSIDMPYSNTIIQSNKQLPKQTEEDKKELEKQNEYWQNITPDELNDYLTKNPNINAKDKRSWTPLMWAAKESQNPEIIKILLQKGADVHITDNEGWTPFLFGIHKNQNMEIIQLLLDNGSDIQKTTDIGQNALHLAAKNNQNPKITQMLIDKGFPINKRDKSKLKFTPMMYAVANNKNPEVMYTLMNNGALVHEKDSIGNSTLMLAALNNQNIEVIQKLLDEKLVIDQRNKLGMTALHFATRNENPKILAYLLEKGADKTAKLENIDALGTAALFATQPEIIKILIKNGFDINTKYNIGTYQYLHQLNASLKKYDTKQTTIKLSPLVLAISNNTKPEITQALINAGANINERLFFGFTPLFLSLSNDNPDVIKTLISNGAETHLRAKDKSTPIIFALQEIAPQKDINPEIIEILVAHGVDINAKTSTNETALLLAAKNAKNPEIIETLIRLGADIKARDDTGKMVLDYAKKNPKIKNTKTYQKLKELYFQK